MSAHTDVGPRVSRRLFLVVFGVVALIIAGVLSYAASSSPDGLDSATMRGCQTVVTDGREELIGDCIAQQATDHALGSSPLADYALHGRTHTNGIAGVVGVVVTLAVAVGLFWLLIARRSARSSGETANEV
ncbi:PDGLE domain-containing protein [Gordonia sp. CPCC 206044]|uniref:PDGLE domain-containing protein n=1 Tax=Gordonia sp. CPCC 206044 TaxID=3140793 RepID=UPI003AF37E5B